MDKTRIIPKILLLLVISGSSAVFNVLIGKQTKKPNIIVILADDMGWSDIGCYGSEIPTPNLDKLAMNGIRYSQFYNTGRCSPTRASLLTGHYPHQAGMGHLDGYVIPGSQGFQGKINNTSVTLAEVLRSAGYFTAMTGKWHVGQDNGTTPWGRGFMRSLNLARGGYIIPIKGEFVVNLSYTLMVLKRNLTTHYLVTIGMELIYGMNGDLNLLTRL